MPYYRKGTCKYTDNNEKYIRINITQLLIAAIDKVPLQLNGKANDFILYIDKDLSYIHLEQEVNEKILLLENIEWDSRSWMDKGEG